ncbi:ATP-binding cassette domain-containing protein [Gordonia humi]|uniref:Energy-coupling factor transporter ATP-binding protein EcfA2 n=1 Tax=Gordonia humi TaxID=686429 RepID=A0A840EPF8_9ACTN|nr:ATP-binding cassette domain-containing protein [Gordonia humi]MBB4133582.1 energy-coupling factor transporter ATP-binding protein EcfA2 [Gordonia humi]
MTSAQQTWAVVARGLEKTSVYGPLDLDIPVGGLTVLTGPAGSGRTCLLLTLAGRMKPKSGDLSVMGETRPKRIFARAAIGAVDDLDAVYDAVTVGALVTEKRRWDAPWYRLIVSSAQSVEDVCRPVFGPLPVPDPKAYVEDLSELDVFLLRVALANTKRPPLLVAGAVDQLSSTADQYTALARLVELGREQTVITATSNPVDDVGQRLVLETPGLTPNDLIHNEGTN